MPLEAIRYSPGSLVILDQLLLPHAERWIPILSAEDAWNAIRTMQVRGAPAIAIVAALSVAVEQQAFLAGPSSASEARDAIVSKLQYLVTSRPTAVNLSDAAGKLSALVGRVASSSSGSSGGREVRQAYISAAEQMLADDVGDNTAIGAFGARWILARAEAAGTVAPGGKVSVMTHCNTGSLATAGYGTALGIVRSLHAAGRLARVYYGETRPYNQGARLTGYELLHDGIPATLVTDSMAGALMAQRGPVRQAHVGRTKHYGEAKDGDEDGDRDGDEDGDDSAPLVAVVVGADRVAANGDTANKIGTYSLAVLARHHGVAFVVAAPRTTVDLKTAAGADIEIEQRRQDEVTVLRGPTVVRQQQQQQEGEAPPRGSSSSSSGGIAVDLAQTREVSIAPLRTTAWNPAFDVTPAPLVDAIATEVGVVEKPPGHTAFDLAPLFSLDRDEARKLADHQPDKMPDPTEGP